MARSINGFSDHIDLANEANFDREWTQVFSASLWVRLPVPSIGAVLSKVNGAVPNGWAFNTEPTGGNVPQLHLISSTGDGLGVFGNNNAIPLGTWTQIGYSYDGSGTIAGCKIYASGAISPNPGSPNVDFGAITTGTILSASPVRLGFIDVPEYWGGEVAGLGIWDIILSAGDFTTLGTGADPLTVQNANLIASLPLCGVAVTEPDKKGTNNGTLFGTTSVPGPFSFVGCPQPIAWTVA